jgi:hypothetical protein
VCISLNRVVASLVIAAVIFSAVQQAAALGPRIGGIGAFRGGFGGFHRGGERFRIGDHLGRFNDRHFGRFANGLGNGLFLGGLYGLGYPYDFGYPYDSGYPSDPPGPNVSVASPGASSAYSGGPAGSYTAPVVDCVLYTLKYDETGKYQGVTASHPCQ